MHMQLETACRARVDGLTSRTALNGAEVELLSFHEASGRWCVRDVQSGEAVRIKPGNLTRIAMPTQLDSLGDDELAAVLSQVPFRDPQALIPPGFYWRPPAHTTLRLVCSRFKAVLDSRACHAARAAAPVGRVTLAEASNHVQTCVRLGATIIVRGAIAQLKTVNSAGTSVGCCHDSTGCMTLVFPPHATRQLRSVRPLTSPWAPCDRACCTFEEYQQIDWFSEVGGGASALFDGGGAFAIDEFTTLVMRCRFARCDPSLYSALPRRRVQHPCPYDLVCVAIEIPGGAMDEPAVDWKHEGKALLRDIDTMLRCEQSALVDAWKPIPLPGWRELVAETESHFPPHNPDAIFAEQIFSDFGAGDMDDENHTRVYWTEGTWVCRARDEHGRWRYFFEDDD